MLLFLQLSRLMTYLELSLCIPQRPLLRTQCIILNEHLLVLSQQSAKFLQRWAQCFHGTRSIGVETRLRTQCLPLFHHCRQRCLHLVSGKCLVALLCRLYAGLLRVEETFKFLHQINISYSLEYLRYNIENILGIMVDLFLLNYIDNETDQQ